MTESSLENTSAIRGAHDPVELYAADLAWLDRLIEREILRLRTRYELSLDEFRGLYISDQQVDDLIRERMPEDFDVGGPVERLTAEACLERGRRSGKTPLDEVAERLALSPTDRDLLFLALAPELDLRYETLYAYLNDDVTRRHLTPNLASRLLTRSGIELGRATLLGGGRLFDLGIVEWLDSAEHRSTLARGIVLAPSAIEQLRGALARDPRLPDGVRLIPCNGADARELEESLSPTARVTIDEFARRRVPRPGLVVCCGEVPKEQLSAAQRYASSVERLLLAVPSSVLSSPSGESWSDARRRLAALARIANAVLVVYEEAAEVTRDSSSLAQLARHVRELVGSELTVIWAPPPGVPWAGTLLDLPYVELTLPGLEYGERAAVWREALGREELRVEECTIQALAERFDLAHSRIASAARAASMALRDPEGPGLVASVWRAARRYSGQALAELADLVVKPHTWEQLVLPGATLRQVRHFASAITHRERVYHEWRMAERTGRGRGLTALFAGASGTGKTMAAAVIANHLGLDLYRVDLASVVSKYIGETEKNLARVFRAARRSNAVLFFDEADALLGKRSEVKDAHDRYANIEVAYLLQRMEDHDGVVILASNLAKNLDQAFARRMHYVIAFPRPDAELRERLWRGMFPREAPVADGVDFRFLAEQFETTGGDIQTIALDAAFLASAEGSSIEMEHIVRAMARHRLEQGNPCSPTEFRQYHDLARRG